MITSTLSQYKDVAYIIPATRLTSEQIKSMILNIITEIHKIGLKIISLISNNNAVNRQALLLSSGTSVFLTQSMIVESYSPYLILFILLNVFVIIG